MNIKISLIKKMSQTTVNFLKSLDYSEVKQIKPIFTNSNCKVLQLVLKKGQGLSEHSTPIDAFLHVIEGECELSMAGKIYILKENDTIVLPKGVLHEVWAKNSNARMLLTR